MSNQKHTVFSLASVLVWRYDNNNIVGQPITLPSSLEVPMPREAIKTMGGASQWATDARNARVDGNGKLALANVPQWLRAAATGAEYRDVAAPSSATVTAGQDLVGATVAAAVTIQPTVGATVNAGEIFVEYVGAGTSSDTAKIKLSVAGDKGGFYSDEIDNVGDGAEGYVVKSLGVTIEYDNTNPPSAGDSARWTTNPASAKRVVEFGSAMTSVHYGLRGWTYKNENDNVDIITVRKLLFTGNTFMATDNEAAVSEFEFCPLDPCDGEAPVTIEQLVQ